MSKTRWKQTTERNELLQRVTELQQQLQARQNYEYHRIVWLSEGVRQELQGVIGIDHIFEVLGEKNLSGEQWALLEMISEKGNNILSLLQQYCDGVNTEWVEAPPAPTELDTLRQRVMELEQQVQERDETLYQSQDLLRQFFLASLAVMHDDDDGVVNNLVQLLDPHSDGIEGPDTGRVVDLTLALSQVIGFSEPQLSHIRRGALLHDIGEVLIPDTILQKPAPLTNREYAIVQLHPIYAYNLLSSIPALRYALDIPYCHHERWDGSGYPRGLRAEQIPLAARIFAVADVYDAMCSHRPYRSAWKREQVSHYLIEQSGKQFDPQVVNVFLQMDQHHVLPRIYTA